MQISNITVTTPLHYTSPPVIISLIYSQKSCNLDAVTRDTALHFAVRCKVTVNFGRHKDKEKVEAVICGAVHSLQVPKMDTVVTVCT